MYDRKSSLETPSEFNFPFEPYDIQRQLMQEHFRAIEEKRIGIFESPTGTGKTLTLLCSALTWLLKHESVLQEEIQSETALLTKEIAELEKENEKSNDWISAQYETLKLREKLSDLKNEKDLLVQYYKDIQDIKKNSASEKVYTQLPEDEKFPEEAEEDRFFIDEESEVEEAPSEETRFRDVKIFFCSRTHSQLSQAISEVKRTVFKKDTRVTALASRQNYCINVAVRALKSSSLINERCLEMQKSKEKAKDSGAKKQKLRESTKRCPFYSSGKIEVLKGESVKQIMDIEDLVSLAKSQKACPYYSSRLATVFSQLVVVPYQMILHKKTREQLGIDISNSVLIIDEAHNLIDTISNIHSAVLRESDLVQVRANLESYRLRYLKRFSPSTALKVKQLAFVAKSFLSLLKSQTVDTRMLTVADLIYEAELFDFNLLELVKFAEKTRLAHKVHGLAVSEQRKTATEVPKPKQPSIRDFLKSLENSSEKTQEQISEKPKEAGPLSNVIRPFLALLEALVGDSDDGRVLLSKNPKSSFVKYLILNPGAHFQDIVASCRSVTLAGGTMQPVDEVVDQLFAEQRERVTVSCFGHVVPKESVLALALGKGPSGKEMLFNFANRENSQMFRDLASSVMNVCNVVPSGVVCFFPSYDYIEKFHRFLTQEQFLPKLEQKKVVFIETRQTQAESLLDKYSKAIRALKNGSKQNGALLLSVVGGKLSEGLNFSDDLGRCVMVIGLPFPNKTDPELVERMKYLDEHLGGSAGREYYENLCMKAVNQCIGRAVRHINDFASVVLLDSRYSQPYIQRKLPSWIARSLVTVENFGRAQQSLVAFFKGKQANLL